MNPGILYGIRDTVAGLVIISVLLAVFALIGIQVGQPLLIIGALLIAGVIRTTWLAYRYRRDGPARPSTIEDPHHRHDP